MSPTRPGLAVQLYTLRSLPLEVALAGVARAGYRAVETVGFHGLAPALLRERLAERGLTAVSAHLPLAAVEEVSSVVPGARALGIDVVVLPYLLEPDRPRDAAGWRAFGHRLAQIAVAYADDGIRLIYHNHEFEFVELEGRPAIGWLLEGAAGSPLGLEPDVAWIARAGHDPVAFLDGASVPCPRVHVKDVAGDVRAGAAEEEGGWADVGSGTLAWDRVLPAAARAGAQCLIVEHDAPSDPLGSIERSFTFLASRRPSV